MLRLPTWVIGLCVCLCLLAGCDATEPPATLIKQPKLPEENQAILHALKKNMPKNASLLEAAHSESGEKVNLIHLDNEKDPEVIFFYGVPFQSVHFAVLKKMNHQWKKIYDEAVNGQIATVMVSRLTSGHYRSLILGFMESPNNQLSVYTLNGDKIEKNFTGLYMDALISDLNHDSRPDMTVIAPASDNGKANIDVYQFDDADEPVLIGRQLIEASGMQKLIRKGKVSLGQKTAFVSTISGKGRTISGYAFDKERFVKVPLSGKQENCLSAERPFFFSPVRFALSGTTVQAPGKHGSRSGSPLYPERYTDNKHRFFVDFPQEWRGHVKIKKAYSDHVRFVSRETGKTLLSVYWLDKSTAHEARGWVKIGETVRYLYMVPKQFKDVAEIVHVMK